MNPYQVLQVSESASGEVIRAAWAALVRDCHPDGPKPNEKRTRQLNEAYGVLKDPEKRNALDQQLKASVKLKTRHREPNPAAQNHHVPDYPPAYPDAYVGMSEDDIDDAIDVMTRKAPPFVKFAVDVLRETHRRRS